MTPRAVNYRHALESCTIQLHAWKPFQIQTFSVEPSKHYPFHSKKPCLSDRSTAPVPTAAAETLDLSKLNLLDDPPSSHRDSFRWFARKRRRRGSRSVSGRSSDWSGTHRRRGGGASAAYATCSDFPLAAGGTDSSGELFVNGEGSWGSDVSEMRISRREGGKEVAVLERVSSGSGLFQGGGGNGVLESQGNESGYGSEPGYRGDVEFGYGDEFDEEDDDGRQLFWGDRFGGGDTARMEIVGENKFSEQKTHHRCRRKKHDWRIFAPLR